MTTSFSGINHNANILLVDDEVDILAMLKNGLKNHGFHVDAFNDPKYVAPHFRRNHYDLIIIDVRMPGMNGFQLAREIWNEDKDATICLMTAFDIYESEAKKVFPNFKTYCFIKKPATPSSLAKHIESHFHEELAA